MTVGVQGCLSVLSLSLVEVVKGGVELDMFIFCNNCFGSRYELHYLGTTLAKTGHHSD